jgi:integrase/recombinase XerD
MSALSAELDRYLTIRRGLGYDLCTAERIQRRFTAFAEHEGADIISTALFQRWQETFGHANRHTWSRRLGTVRLFAEWMHGMDQRQVPPQALIPGRQRRPRPYIYSEEEIRSIFEAAAELPSINGIRALTCSTLFGLIAVTGLSVSEALSLLPAGRYVARLPRSPLIMPSGRAGSERARRPGYSGSAAAPTACVNRDWAGLAAGPAMSAIPRYRRSARKRRPVAMGQ